MRTSGSFQIAIDKLVYTEELMAAIGGFFSITRLLASFSILNSAEVEAVLAKLGGVAAENELRRVCN